MVKRNRDGRRIMLRVTSERVDDPPTFGLVRMRGVLYVGSPYIGGKWWAVDATYSFIRARGVTDADIFAIEKLRAEIVQHLHSNFRAWLKAQRSPP